MARPISGIAKVYRVKVKQRNGGYYVYDRTEIYRDGRMRKVGKDVLIGKILPGDTTQTIVPTRPKRKVGRKNQTDALAVKTIAPIEVVEAKRTHIGANALLDMVAEKTGIEEDIYSLLDQGTAQKLISCARFLTCTDGECLSHIGTWQLTHPIAYADGLSKDICHRLTQELGLDETFRQRLFQCRIARQEGELLVVAYDASTVSTYSENQIDARYGFNKANDGLKTIKILALYASELRNPLGFVKQPGNIPDVSSVKNALEQLSILTSRKILLVTDNGFYSEQNSYELVRAGISFLMRIEITTKWVKKHLEECLEDLEDSCTCCSADGHVVGLTRTVVHAFEKKGEDGVVHFVKKRCYLHFFLDTDKHNNMAAEYRRNLDDIKSQLEMGISAETLTKDAQNLVKKHICAREYNGKTEFTIDDKSVKEACRLNGVFAVLGNGYHEETKSTKAAYTTYINREHVEDHFRAEKQTVDGDTVRSWYGDNYLGRLTIQFVALIYEDCLWSEMHRIKSALREDIAKSKISGKDKTIATKKQKLLTWLNQQSVHSLLAWFDAIERTDVSSQIRSKRWNSETTDRDRLFLQMFGFDLNHINT